MPIIDDDVAVVPELDNSEVTSSSETEEDETDPTYLALVQDQFQDDIVETIFYNCVEYLRNTAAPLAEYLSQDDVEDIIDALSVL